MESVNLNVAEIIPYENFREKINLVKQEIERNRHVEIWNNYIYSAEKWQKC